HTPPRPAPPLVLGGGPFLGLRPPPGQKDALDCPVEAAGAAQPRHIPAPRHDLRSRARKHAAPVERATIRVAARLAILANRLEAPQHPGGFLTAAAELPAAADAVTAGNWHRLSAARNRSAGNDCVRPLPVDFGDRLVRQPESDQLAAAPVAEVPTNRAGALGQQLDDAQISQRVDLE